MSWEWRSFSTEAPESPKTQSPTSWPSKPSSLEGHGRLSETPEASGRNSRILLRDAEFSMHLHSHKSIRRAGIDGSFSRMLMSILEIEL